VNGKHASIGCLDWAQVPTWQLARRFPAALICWLGDIKAWMLSRSLDPTFVARPGDVVAPTPQDRRSTSIASVSMAFVVLVFCCYLCWSNLLGWSWWWLISLLDVKV